MGKNSAGYGKGTTRYREFPTLLWEMFQALGAGNAALTTSILEHFPSLSLIGKCSNRYPREHSCGAVPRALKPPPSLPPTAPLPDRGEMPRAHTARLIENEWQLQLMHG